MINVVFAFPPKLDFNKCVSFESRYGMWTFTRISLPSPLFFSLGFCVKARIQFPRALKLWFMLCASLSVWPLALVLPTLSLPAKSTRNSWDRVVLHKPPPSSVRCRTLIDTTTWERELWSFILVLAIARDAPPFRMACSRSTAHPTRLFTVPSNHTPRRFDSRIFKPLLNKTSFF